ncbi:MAG: DUF1826 domain-containing protein [Planctomycetota bacterium]
MAIQTPTRPGRPATPAASRAAVECDDLVDLAAILDPEVHVAIWRRPVESRIVDLLTRDDCGFGRYSPSRFVGRSAGLDLKRDLMDLVPAGARAADPDGALALAEDVFGLCGMFSELLCADEVMVSLESPDDATCPRFHVDRVGIRMLVTYVGPGTEWLPDEHVDRRWLGSAGMDLPDDENGLMRPGAMVQQVSPFDVVLLKGEAWPGAEDFGAVHRSPDPTGQARVLLRVDMLSQRGVSAAENLGADENNG